ncbi:hypothetical protein JCM16303_002586 [Sporobolomyces ruberrimus]
MNYSQGLPTSSAPRPAHRDVPSPFLSSPFAAPRTPLQPSDLYGARLKANLDNVKRELGEMRTDLEGVMQIKDELDSVRRELALIKELVRAQGELLEKRVLDAVSALFESRLAPLFASLLLSSNSVSASFKEYDSNATARARAQNARIEAIEASTRRRLEEVEAQLTSDRNDLKRGCSTMENELEERVRKRLDEQTKQILDDIASRVQAQITKSVEEENARKDAKFSELARKVSDLSSTVESLEAVVSLWPIVAARLELKWFKQTTRTRTPQGAQRSQRPQASPVRSQDIPTTARNAPLSDDRPSNPLQDPGRGKPTPIDAGSAPAQPTMPHTSDYTPSSPPPPRIRIRGRQHLARARSIPPSDSPESTGPRVLPDEGSLQAPGSTSGVCTVEIRGSEKSPGRDKPDGGRVGSRDPLRIKIGGIDPVLPLSSERESSNVKRKRGTGGESRSVRRRIIEQDTSQNQDGRPDAASPVDEKHAYRKDSTELEEEPDTIE